MSAASGTTSPTTTSAPISTPSKAPRRAALWGPASVGAGAADQRCGEREARPDVHSAQAHSKSAVLRARDEQVGADPAPVGGNAGGQRDRGDLEAGPHRLEHRAGDQAAVEKDLCAAGAHDRQLQVEARGYGEREVGEERRRPDGYPE